MDAPLGHGDAPRELNAITGRIVDAAVEVHRHLGPGLLESAYREALAHELRTRGSFVRARVPVPLEYKGLVLKRGTSSTCSWKIA